MQFNQIILEFFKLLNAYEKALFANIGKINQQHIDLILLRLEQFKTSYAHAPDDSEKENVIKKNQILIDKIRNYLK